MVQFSWFLCALHQHWINLVSCYLNVFCQPAAAAAAAWRRRRVLHMTAAWRWQQQCSNN
jgi:hypothetical protein